jgi:hypothetical protein
MQSGEFAKVLDRPVRKPGEVSGLARRLPADEVELLVRGYYDGKSVRNLAVEFRISRSTAAEHLKRRGVILRPTVLSSETTRALALHAEGLVPNRIGIVMGRDPKTIRAILRRNGLSV